MTKEEIDTVSRLVMTIAGGAIGGLVILVIGNRLRGASDAAVKRKRYRSYLCLLRRGIESKSPDDFLFHPAVRQVTELEKESLEVRHCIQERLTSRFDASLAKYKSVTFDQFSGPDRARQQARDTTNQKAKGELLFNLDEMSSCAWWAV